MYVCMHVLYMYMYVVILIYMIICIVIYLQWEVIISSFPLKQYHYTEEYY